jgi:hypothetical protein
MVEERETSSTVSLASLHSQTTRFQALGFWVMGENIPPSSLFLTPVAAVAAVAAIAAVAAETGGDAGEESRLRGLSGGVERGVVAVSAEEEEEKEEGGGEDQGIFLTWKPEKRTSKGLVWKKE